MPAVKQKFPMQAIIEVLTARFCDPSPRHGAIHNRASRQMHNVWATNCKNDGVPLVQFLAKNEAEIDAESSEELFMFARKCWHILEQQFPWVSEIDLSYETLTTKLGAKNGWTILCDECAEKYGNEHEIVYIPDVQTSAIITIKNEDVHYTLDRSGNRTDIKEKQTA